MNLSINNMSIVYYSSPQHYYIINDLNIRNSYYIYRFNSHFSIIFYSQFISHSISHISKIIYFLFMDLSNINILFANHPRNLKPIIN
jgi:hypothetical protein